jgi:hypothetical protein
MSPHVYEGQSSILRAFPNQLLAAEKVSCRRAVNMLLDRSAAESVDCHCAVDILLRIHPAGGSFPGLDVGGTGLPCPT